MLPSMSKLCTSTVRPVAAAFSTGTTRQHHSSGRSRQQHHRHGGSGGKTNGGGRWSYGKSAATGGTTVLALSWMTTIKDVLGIEKVQLDADPLKEKVKQSWLYRKRRQYDDAIQVLQLALEEAEERKEDMPITRVYDEMANTFYEKMNLDEADKYFRIVIQRLVQLHGKKDFDPEFIGVSLKLADILAHRGDLESAESGFKHCVRRQMKVMEEHMKKFSVAHGALVEDRHTVDTFGPMYTDPIALFGMTLEAYANFLINYCGETRMAEVEEYIDEVMKISYQIYGASSAHTINMLNNFGATLVLKNRFELAKKYLAIGVDRILYVNECAHMLPGYYCNYAESLFHTGQKNEALEFARKAVQMSRSGDDRVRHYTQNFLNDLEKDINRGKPKSWWFF
ncbi:TPR_REGION domain-containing protein [Caenorhabditis elegans]|uniref:TPR_REGION domain-containing protein n=1 Tax=Caenorhabditis elegans TaxID=6239 RepID=Q7K742_CAEEL|nr:TPR_REGION domain-containing protein [Caenorhabditis elegans]CAE46690.1 TPR_REGION domain-containing protein [Caenorhabditis elegans]|eukprot:NP_001022476.1 Daf-16-Dependent Longevity (WT but not daf-16 lifespan increased) [Caenorhabditis elegans]